jgi:hypothetical protein
VTLLITNKLGRVHRSDANCRFVARADKTKPVTPVQCHAYALVGCDTCFPSIDLYRKAIRGWGE